MRTNYVVGNRAQREYFQRKSDKNIVQKYCGHYKIKRYDEPRNYTLLNESVALVLVPKHINNFIID